MRVLITIAIMMATYALSSEYHKELADIHGDAFTGCASVAIYGKDYWDTPQRESTHHYLFFSPTAARQEIASDCHAQ